MTSAVVMTCVVGHPTGLWSAPLSFAPPAEQAAPAAQEVAPLGQSGEAAASFSVEGGWAWQLRADIDNTGNGRFTHDRGHARLRGRIPLREDLELLLGVRQQRDNFGFSNMVAPWGSINTTQVDAALQLQATQRWQVFGGGMARWAAEEGGSLGEGFVGGGAFGAAYAITEDLILGGGVGIQTQIEDDLLVYPIVVAEWSLTERLRLSTSLTTGWANQTGGEIVYAATESIDIGVSAVFDYQRFRLSDDAAVPGGAGVTEALPVNLFVSMNVCQRASVTAFVGINAYGRLKTVDSAGRDVWARNHDPAPVLGIQGTIRF
ncbi:MAG: hypothetical protein QF561_05685 [Phycisphaerales bacterium]|nr:hypothetical protein [Phycisphaerales bacterium]